MSLKHFHLFFITLSIITSAGFGVWCFVTERGKETEGAAVMGAISFATAIGLVVYLIKFLGKLKRENL